MEKLEEVGEDIFVSPVVVTWMIGGSVKIAIDVELNRQILRKTTYYQTTSDMIVRHADNSRRVAEPIFNKDQ